MKREDLERWLNKGNSFGFQLRDDEYSIAWVILSRGNPIHRFFELFTPGDNPKIYADQIAIRDKPYQIWIAELPTVFYNAERHLRNEDYLKNEVYRFTDLDEVASFFKTMDLDIAQLKWNADIRFF